MKSIQQLFNFVVFNYKIRNMKKTNLLSSLFMILIGGVTLFSSCASDDTKLPPEPDPPATLDAPKNITCDRTGLFKWDKVANATGYQIAFDNISDVVYSKVYLNDSIRILEPTKDVWRKFFIRSAFLSNGSILKASETVSYDFIITDKTILETPSNFSFDILEQESSKLKVKFYWKNIANAAKYKLYCEIYNPKSSITVRYQEDNITTNEWTAPTSITSGSTVTLEVTALPESNSPTYVLSKTGSAKHTF